MLEPINIPIQIRACISFPTTARLTRVHASVAGGYTGWNVRKAGFSFCDLKFPHAADQPRGSTPNRRLDPHVA